jgi:hypothetical protein
MRRFWSSVLLLSILSIPAPPVGAEEPAAPPQESGSSAAVDAGGAAAGSASGGDAVTREDLDALKDLLDEQIRRGVASRYTVNLSGFGILGYYGFRNSPDTFGLNAAGITLSGNLREDPLDEGDLKYRVSLLFPGNAATALSRASASSTSTFDPADNTVSTSTTVTTGKTFVSSPLLTDVFLTWDLLTPKRKLEPAVTLSATFGQQLVPFGQDNFATEDKQPTVKKALYLSRLGIGRDIGLKAEGGVVNRHDPASGVTTPLLAYTLALFNGSGANRNDDNRDKDFVGKLIVTPSADYFSFFRGLKFGGSYYAGRAGAAGTGKVVRERVGAEVEWLKKPFLVTGEYVVGRDDRKKSRGYVGTLFWTPGTLPDFQPLLRYDRFDPDTSRGGDAVRVVTAGFNYFFYQVEPVTRRTYEVLKTERVIKAQFNYNFVRQDAAPRTNDEYVAQVVYSF